MTPQEKTFYGLMILAATTFGGMVYKTQTDRIGVLEATAETHKAQRTSDQITLAEVRLDLKYTREAMERVERKLDALILPPVSRPPALPKLYSVPQTPLQGP